MHSSWGFILMLRWRTFLKSIACVINRLYDTVAIAANKNANWSL